MAKIIRFHFLFRGGLNKLILLINYIQKNLPRVTYVEEKKDGSPMK